MSRRVVVVVAWRHPHFLEEEKNNDVEILSAAAAATHNQDFPNRFLHPARPNVQFSFHPEKQLDESRSAEMNQVKIPTGIDRAQ